MTSATLAILTIGIVPLQEIMSLLTEHIPQEQITYVNLLGKMTREEAIDEYASHLGEELITVRLNDDLPLDVSKPRIERDIQAIINVLDGEGYDVILLMTPTPLDGMRAKKSILLEPQRFLSPLVRSIVDGHRMGVIVPGPEMLTTQRNRWLELQNPPSFALANPLLSTDAELITAARQLLADGADVVMLDSPGFQLHHSELLQKTLDVPVVLSSVLLARLTIELLS
ncbi:AroM family protein [Pluralibacter gergoviae]